MPAYPGCPGKKAVKRMYVTQPLKYWSARMFCWSRAQVKYDSVANDCRLGTSPPGRPFSGVTAVLDYSTHAHKDVNNMLGGCTAVRYCWLCTVASVQPRMIVDRRWWISNTAPLAALVTHIHTHNHFTALWILSGTTRVSRYQKKHSLKRM